MVMLHQFYLRIIQLCFVLILNAHLCMSKYTINDADNIISTQYQYSLRVTFLHEWIHTGTCYDRF